MLVKSILIDRIFIVFHVLFTVVLQTLQQVELPTLVRRHPLQIPEAFSLQTSPLKYKPGQGRHP